MFWPMIQKYRHVIASNPERLICNKRLPAANAGKPLASSVGSTPGNCVL